MPSGAGHDAMKLHAILPQAMLFVRGEQRRHQPQPAGVDHQPTTSTSRYVPSSTSSTNSAQDRA
jgi:N-carbamoyl-L-amino-acid hydrolase